jgi:hypothetical protein
MNITTFDAEAFLVDAESFFYLHCCDCNLRHLVVLETVGNGSRDDEATKLSRKKDSIVVYKRKQKEKNGKKQKK